VGKEFVHVVIAPDLGSYIGLMLLDFVLTPVWFFLAFIGVQNWSLGGP
jgi:hypothetical protein